MGNGLSTEEKARQLEKDLLRESGLEIGKDLHITDIEIDYLGENRIHTVKCGEGNTNVLVMLHGYGGSSVFYYKMLKELSLEYKVYCIDLLGMGLSSRPEFNCKNTQDTINFFVESIEQWRLSIGLDKFTICGHSFGGYMAAQYAHRFKKNVNKLILFSPLGFTKDIIETTINKNYVDNLTFLQRRFYYFRRGFFEDKKTISDFANSYACFAGLFIKKRFLKRLKVHESDAGNILWEFLLETYKLPKSSEKAIHYIINHDILAFQSLEEILIYLDLPMYVLYGDNDWMCSKGARRLSQQGKENYEFIRVKECGHQMTMENPEELLTHIHEIFKGDNLVKEDLKNVNIA